MLNMLALLQEAASLSVGDGLASGLAVIGGGLAVLGAGVMSGPLFGSPAIAESDGIRIRIVAALTTVLSGDTTGTEGLANIQTGAIILAALIEGAALFGLVIAGFIK